MIARRAFLAGAAALAVATPAPANAPAPEPQRAPKAAPKHAPTPKPKRVGALTSSGVHHASAYEALLYDGEGRVCVWARYDARGRLCRTVLA